MKTWLFAFTIATLVGFASLAPGQEPNREDESKAIHKRYSEIASEYEIIGRVISNVDVTAPLWNPRGKSKQQIRQRAQFFTDAFEVKRTPEQQGRAKLSWVEMHFTSTLSPRLVLNLGGCPNQGEYDAA